MARTISAFLFGAVGEKRTFSPLYPAVSFDQQQKLFIILRPIIYALLVLVSIEKRTRQDLEA